MTAEDQGSEGNGPTPPGSPIYTAGGSARSGSQGLPPGTTAKWQGPYEVVEREGEVNYRVRQPGRQQIHKQPDTGDERSRQACKRGVPSRSSALLSTVCRAQSSAHGQCQTHAIAAGGKKQREETSDPRSRNSP
ncbi:unnamed protein product [Gadus morhua 'NCC']